MFAELDKEYSFVESLGHYAWSEIVDTMLRLAVALRIHDDLSTSRDLQTVPSVGLITPDADQPDKTEALDLRESCNKIIHAKKIKYVHLSSEISGKEYLKPQLIYQGCREIKGQRKQWIARIDSLRFIESIGLFLDLQMRPWTYSD
jgi:hypothetical protein